MAMIAERIKIQPFEFTRLLACEIIKEVGTHGYARLQGYISPDKEEEYLSLAGAQSETIIEAMDQDGSTKRLYCGFVKDIKITYENQVYRMDVTIAPYTHLLDIKPERRSFQNPAMTYEAVMKTILASYAGGDVICGEGRGEVIGDLFVQYQETDWEFFARLASRFQTVLIPSYTTSGAKLYFGLEEGSEAVRIHPVSYEAQKLVCDHLYKEQNDVSGLVEDDAICYLVEEQELYEPGQRVEFRGRAYYVARAESHLNGHQLWNRYLLKTKAGFKLPRHYHGGMIGASLDGVITAVQGDQVKVSLRVDAGGSSGKWFPFSTVYSSPDGTGWYCMPEPGDEIRLYFPTEREKHGYVISSVHLPVGQTSGVSRKDPSHKVISTNYGKVVDLAKDYIRLQGKNGMEILIDDQSGIVIKSSQGVSISSSAIQIASLSGAVEISGSAGVSISQGSNKINVAQENVTIEGANTKVQ